VIWNAPREPDRSTPRATDVSGAGWLATCGVSRYARATGGDGLPVRVSKDGEQVHAPSPLPPAERDELACLVAVVRGTLRPAGLSSLENNRVVTRDR
jgi:hypothetical protein